jgi:hypothetical protein
MFRRALVAAAFLVALPSTASADARKDIVDIRSGQLPVRHEMLGWTSSNEAIVRSLVCRESGTAFCNASISILRPGAGTSVKLLEINEVYCSKGSPCQALDTPTAMSFISAESRALAGLPAHSAGTSLSDPAAPFGRIAGDATTIGFRQLAVKRGEDEGVTVDLVLRGARGAAEPLAKIESFTPRVERAPKIVGAYLSPDGKRVALAVEYAIGFMCWGPVAELDVSVIDVAPRRASLANSVAFRAYNAGDMNEALAGFTEATTIDPSYALAWFNRAAVESRLGKLDEATSSLRKAEALDASMEQRACKDADFDALRADGRAAGSLRCAKK